MVFGFGPDEQPLWERTLGRLGHRAFGEASVEAACARVERSDVKVVIADGRVPKFEWLELCRQLRSDPARPYVYILLAGGPDSDESHEAWAAESGVDDFLVGEADERELWRRLRLAARTVEAERRSRQSEAALAICSYCKRVRDDEDHWSDLDYYIGRRLRGQITPVICPDCYLKNFGPEFRASRVSKAALPALGAELQPPI